MLYCLLILTHTQDNLWIKNPYKSRDISAALFGRLFPGFPSIRFCNLLWWSAVSSMYFSVQISTLRLRAQASLEKTNNIKWCCSLFRTCLFCNDNSLEDDLITIRELCDFFTCQPLFAVEFDRYEWIFGFVWVLICYNFRELPVANYPRS